MSFNFTEGKSIKGSSVTIKDEWSLFSETKKVFFGGFYVARNNNDSTGVLRNTFKTTVCHSEPANCNAHVRNCFHS